MTHPTPTSGECQAYPAYADRVKEILGELEKVIESKFSIENESLRGYLGTKIDKIDGLCKQLDEAEEENKKLREALDNLYKEIRSRFATDDAIAFESMTNDLEDVMRAARKLLKP